jgi:hypothetical protein
MFMNVNFVDAAMDGGFFGVADFMATFQTTPKFRPPAKFRPRRSGAG